MIQQLVHQSEWLIPALILFIASWVRFNLPPTNPSGTTFALFFFGAMFYYCLIIPLWLLVSIAVTQSSIGLDWIGRLGRVNPDAQKELSEYAPVIAALIIVAGSQFPWVAGIDKAARSFCLYVAAIPREADRLAIELAQSTKFQPEKLRRKVNNIISENIGPQAFNFSSDGTLPARFTRAVALYWLFVGPRNNNNFDFSVNTHSRAAYARILQLADDVLTRADFCYEDLMQRGLAYFTSQRPSKELKEALSSNITELTQLVCSLIARFVLYCDVTRAGRRSRLSDMGFEADNLVPQFGLDQWVFTIAIVIMVAVGMMIMTPGTQLLPYGEVMTISVTFGLSIGFAVLGAILVAQRFIERNQKNSAFPPVAELTIAAFIVAGLSAVLRIGIPFVSALVQGDSSGLPGAVTQFVNRSPGIVIPFICTISLGLLCSYLGSLNWRWYYIAAVGALGNGLALMAAGWVAVKLVDVSVLSHFYQSQAIPKVIINTAVTGFLVGSMVLAMFNKSERIRKEVAAHAAEHPEAVVPPLDPPVEQLENAIRPSMPEADRNLGGYTGASVEALEGHYVCIRPAFTSTGHITAYVIVIRWDEAASCLTFEERDRVDAGHVQRGRV